MIPYLILAFTTLGCGALFPAPAGDSHGFIGFRFMAGIAAAMVVLYLGNALAGIPLTVMAFVVAAMAGCGLIRLVPEIYSRRFSRACVLHPVLILLLVIGVMIARRDGVEYVPLQGDEYSRWFYFAKLAFLGDGNWTETFRSSYRGHPPGWTILMAYPSLVLGRFSEADAATLPFIVHVGFLGIIYDVSRRAAERIETISFRGRVVVAWLVVLVLLVAGTSWRLVPISFTGEPPSPCCWAHVSRAPCIARTRCGGAPP